MQTALGSSTRESVDETGELADSVAVEEAAVEPIEAVGWDLPQPARTTKPIKPAIVSNDFIKANPLPVCQSGTTHFALGAALLKAGSSCATSVPA
jgi:hypothetical protein